MNTDLPSTDTLSLDELVEDFEAACGSAAIEVEVHELDIAPGGWVRNGTTSPIRRLVRCLRSAGLLDEGPRALAAPAEARWEPGDPVYADERRPQLPELWWSNAHGAVVHRGWRDRPFQIVTTTGLIDLDELPTDAIVLGDIAAQPLAAPAEAAAVVHDPTTEDEDGRCTEYPDLIDRHGARWVWAIGTEYRARHVLGGWKCRDVGYIRSVFGPVTEVPATSPAPNREAALRSKLDEWLAEDGISPYRRTAFVQVLEWLDAYVPPRTIPASQKAHTCPCGTVPEPCPGPEDRPLCMRYSVSREDLS